MSMTADTSGPPDAKTNPEGHRTYRWPNGDGTERELMSVTSIRKLLGEPYGLVRWQLNKIVDRALTLEYTDRLREALHPLPGVETAPDDLLALRKWLHEAATAERDAAADLGKQIHLALELGWTPEQCNAETRPYVRQVRHFLDTEGWDIVAHEKTVWNLAVGYAGTLDVFLRNRADGRIAIGDWKTGKNVHTEHVTQLHGYMGGEFIGTKGIIDAELTAMLRDTNEAGILHLKPTGWHWHPIPFSETVLRGFYGAVWMAQLLAAHKKPDALFGVGTSGSAPE